MDPAALLERLRGRDLANVAFKDVVRLLSELGFEQRRGRGSHQLFAHPSTGVFVNFQDAGGRAKPYQLRQIARLVDRYDLKLEGDR